MYPSILTLNFKFRYFPSMNLNTRKMPPKKTLSSQLLKSVTPKIYSLLRLGLNHDKHLTKPTEEVKVFTRKILQHDIPSLRLTACENGLSSLSSPLIGLKYSILVYNTQLIENQWEGYKSSFSDYNVMINPNISKYLSETETKEEECTVLPALYFAIERPIAIEVEYKDINEIKKNEKFFGFEARVIQHEIDHLKGKLPSNLEVCNGKSRQKYNFELSDKIEKYYEERTKEQMEKLEILYKEDKKFKAKVDSQPYKRDYFLRIILGNQEFDEYMSKKTEAFRLDVSKGKIQSNN